MILHDDARIVSMRATPTVDGPTIGGRQPRHLVDSPIAAGGDEVDRPGELLRERTRSWGPARTAVVVFVALAAVYSTTAKWSEMPYGIDAYTNAITGRAIAVEGTPVVSGYEEAAAEPVRNYLAVVVETPRGPVSQYPPGAALTVAPFYLLPHEPAVEMTLAEAGRPDLPPATVPVPPLWPATLSAVVVTAAALAVLSLTLSRLGLAGEQVLVVALAGGVTTSAWAVASRKPWTHGSAMLAISLACWAASRDRWLGCGLALGAAVLVRPHLAVIAAVVGVWVSVTRRDWRPVLGVGTGSTLGLAALVGFNAVFHGAPSVIGGYSADFAERARDTDLVAYAVNIALGLFAPRYGLLVWAPVVVILACAAYGIRHSVPDWTLAAAVGGVTYLLVQWKANRASGGFAFFPYRYPLEALMAAAPLLGLAAVDWWHTRTGLARRLVPYTLVTATIGQVFGAIAF